MLPPGAKIAKSAPRTTVIKDDLNPHWNDSSVPSLVPRVSCPEDLGRSSLIMAVYDKDLLNADDLLGIAVIKFPSHSKETHTIGGTAFNEPLLLEGRVFGSIEGRICVHWTKEHLDDTATLDVTPDAGGCCTIV